MPSVRIVLLLSVVCSCYGANTPQSLEQPRLSDQLNNLSRAGIKVTEGGFLHVGEMNSPSFSYATGAAPVYSGVPQASGAQPTAFMQITRSPENVAQSQHSYAALVSGQKGRSWFSWVPTIRFPWSNFTHRMHAQWVQRSALYDYVYRHRWSLMFKTGIGALVLLNVRLFNTTRFLLDTERWIYWRSEILLMQLTRIPPQDLVQELLNTLSLRRRFPPDQTPLDMLLQELDHEIRKLRWYLQWAEYVEHLGALHQHIVGIFEPRRSFLPSPTVIMRGMVSEVLNYAAHTVIGLMNVKKLFYIHDHLVLHGSEYLRRLIYLRRVVEEELTIDLPQRMRY
jgi:hypothetical protein